MNRKHRRKAEKNLLVATDRLHRKYSLLKSELLAKDLKEEDRISLEAEMVVIAKAIDIAAENQLKLKDSVKML